MVSRETPLLTLSNISKRYGQTVALQEVSLELQRGEVVALLGPSGSGKSTLLRVVAGLTHPDEGELTLDGREITHVPPHKRGFGMMFQQFALFPHRSVARNIAFGLEMHRWPTDESQSRVTEMLELVGMAGYENRTIFELSGGEQQRVALARSLAPEPPLLLLDEPLGSLDRRLRERLVEELREILSHVSTTAIYVTHDQQEAFTISDRLALMAEGRLMQVGAPSLVYQHPASRFVAEFFGLENIIPVSTCRPGERPHTVIADTPLGPLVVEDKQRSEAPFLIIRAEAASLVDAASGGTENRIVGIVESCSFRGSHYRMVTRHPEVGTLEWELRATDDREPHVGEQVMLAIERTGMAFLPA